VDSDEDLETGLAGLAGLVSGSGELSTTLVHIAQFAVRAIPSADGAGLTMLESDRPQTVVATSPWVTEVDDVQYALAEGPCVSAVAQGGTFTSGNLGGEALWPRFGPRAGRLGVHSALSLPLQQDDGRPIGALNVYARSRDAFDQHAIALGEAFARPAAVSVANARALAQAERLVEQLEQALTSRAEIDQAIGILISRTGASATEAFAVLRARSQTDGTKLAGVAHQLVTEASARARARRSASGTPS
jgi:GAF domain-containing protein